MKVTLKPGMGQGNYDAYADGVKVGEISKRVMRYNLGRPVTSISWKVWLLGDETWVPGGEHRTRIDAVKAIEQHLRDRG